jgi:N-sulfoglucosamine sulfohydrolase
LLVLRRALAALSCLLIVACSGGGTNTPHFIPHPPDDLGPRPPPPAGKLNVLFLMIEDQGELMGAYGTPGLVTPHMDSIAAKGALYPHAWVTMGSCTTSKAAMFTGRYNQLMGVTDNTIEFVGSYDDLIKANPPWFQDPNSIYYKYAIPDSVPTLIEVLWKAGYYLGLQNKFHQSPHWKFPYDHWYQPNYGSSYQEVTDFIAEAHVSGRPWFLVHNIGDAHRPWPDSSKSPSSVDPSKLQLPAHLPDDTVTRTDYAEYFQGIEDADRRVGLALKALQDSGDAANTLIVFMGDNGMEYHRGKFSAYALGQHVAAMFMGPGITQGVVRQELLSGVDLMPTILDFIDVAAPAGMNGASHKDLLTGATTTPPRAFLLGNTRSDRAISDGRYTLVFMPNPADTFIPDDDKLPSPWRNNVYNDIVNHADDPAYAEPYRLLDLADASLTRYDRPRFELYDDQNDPWEIHDLAGDPNYADQLERLKTELRNDMQTLGDKDGGNLP